jgi:DHA2 family multidrug resistance protein
MGCSAFLPTIVTRLRNFDFFGFAMMSIGVGALQLLLDRGGEVDWFSSPEIWVELGISITGFWIFGVHLLTSKHPFFDPHMFTDRNFVTGLIFIFVVGVILLASLALLPPMLARIFGYSTMTIGLVMAPRGMGTMMSMLIVGRLVRIMDARYLVVTGLCLTILSLYMMTGFSPQMDSHLVIWSGVIQGLGLGLVFVPLSTVAFATLDFHYRTDATSLFSLVRNIGSSIGISVVSAYLTYNVQVNHDGLAQHISPFNPMLRAVSPAAANGDPAVLSQMDMLVNGQALMISYVDDFKLMMIVTLCAIPLALLLRKPDHGTKQVPVIVEE